MPTFSNIFKNAISFTNILNNTSYIFQNSKSYFKILYHANSFQAMPENEQQPSSILQHKKKLFCILRSCYTSSSLANCSPNLPNPCKWIHPICLVSAVFSPLGRTQLLLKQIATFPMHTCVHLPTCPSMWKNQTSLNRTFVSRVPSSTHHLYSGP